ncbi:MAG TPA: S8 family serine peptidase [Thermoanaerobaculia bacterium]|nr:S8 family serine peptidase [Thermoanaerobaculia bacterium]
MSYRDKESAETNRILVKMRPSTALQAAEGSRVDLRPLYDTRRGKTLPFGLDATPQWFVADLQEGASSPWDLAHGRVAAQLGVAPSDVVFAEPDIVHDVYHDTSEEEQDVEGFGATEIVCTENPQDTTRGKAGGSDTFAWHLGDEYTQLASARAAIAFTDPLTRIAHIDTGYYDAHVTKPGKLREDLARNFAEIGDPHSAEDPNVERRFLDNSGHGTGTLSILAGGAVPAFGDAVMGGAPGAEIVPIRVADSVVLLRTSALARALSYVVEKDCDVITMSMGGLPSQAWAEAVDKLYEAGIAFCAAGGNRTRPLPPKVLVYPARYARVIAVTGVMANHSPYTGLDGALEGSFGPDAVMKKTLAAYTPNIPWARYRCENIVRLNGEGTSSATPQVAAAVALWFEKYKKVLPRNYQRVEAVRHALYSTAKLKDKKGYFGNGVIQARAALDVAPRLNMPKSEKSRNSFAFLRLLTGLGITEPTPRELMFNLELAQRWMMNENLQELVPDPDDTTEIATDTQRKFMEAIIEDSRASQALRKHVESRYPVVAGGPAPRSQEVPVRVVQPEVSEPAFRRLRVYAVDPSLSTRLSTAEMNEVTLNVRWEENANEYLAIEDHDASGELHPPINLNDPGLLAQDGWAPSEGNPQFHQQMVYAVAMKTISHFEKALGRPVLWRPRKKSEDEFDDSSYVAQLAVHPHALRQANAYYSPQLIALMFGYFEASADTPGEHMPGSRVYTCLSHDIIAHETTHAILDGMYRRFNEPTNFDVLAFHEAFADIVALLQHFTIPELLENEIARTRGDIEAESILGSLAVQFGRAMGGRGALRDAIGRMEDGVWKRFAPDPADLTKRLTPHTRGAVLVAAVFDAFAAIYKSRIADLLRIYTGGTGVLPLGAIHPDLVKRLASEAAKSADHVLTMCIRALDYLPPVDVTFFEYLRALITADFDITRDDRHNYRVAFVEAFRRRAIYPQNLHTPTPDTPRTLSVDTLRWQGRVNLAKFSEQYKSIIKGLQKYADDTIYLNDRENLFRKTRDQRQTLHRQLKDVFQSSPDFADELGLDLRTPEDSFEVHELRHAMRFTADGRYIPQVIVMLTQSKWVEAAGASGYFRGGSTLIVDLSVPEVRYRVVKDIKSTSRQTRTTAFVQNATADPLRAIVFGADGKEPFAVLHALAEEGL